MRSTHHLGFLLLLPVCVIGHAQTPATISFTERGAPLAKVIPRLAETTNLHLAVAVALKKEVVCIEVHDVTVKALMDRLAQVTGAAWTAAEDGIVYLGPSPSVRAAQRAADLAYRTERLSKALAYVPPPKQKPKDGQDAEEAPTMPPALAALLRGIGAPTLAAIPNDTRVVFSTRPTATQEPLDAQAFDVFARLAADQNRQYDEVRKQIAAGGITQQQLEGLPDLPERIVGTPEKLLLIVGRADQMGQPVQLHVELRGYDAQGKVLPVATALLAKSDVSADSDTQGERINISHETRQLAQLQRALRLTGIDEPRFQPDLNSVRFQMAPALRAEATERVFAPDRFDPLAYGDDFLIGLARARQCQLVACVPDTLLSFHHQADDEATTPAEVLFRLQQESSIAVTLDGGWLCLAPRDSDAAELRRVDRTDLARVMRELRADGYLKLDRVLEMSAANMELDLDGVAFEWSEMANASVLQAFGEDWPTVALYASLDDAQRSTLHQTHQLSFRYLSDQQAAFVRHIIYRPEDDNYVSLEHDTPAIQATIGANQAQTGDEPDDYRSEPTEIAPNGLPRDGYITLDDSTEPVVYADQGVNSTIHSPYSMPMRVKVFAARTARTLVPAWAPTTTYKTDRIHIGTRRTLAFRIYVAKNVYRPSAIFGFDFPPGEVLTLDTLPDDIKNAVEIAVEGLKNRPPPPSRDFGGAPPV